VFNAAVENQRAGLALSRNNLVIAFGAHADVMKWQGWVLSYHVEGDGSLTQSGVLVTTPDGSNAAQCSMHHTLGSHRGDQSYANGTACSSRTASKGSLVSRQAGAPVS
jgi:hypothetical protein